MVKEAKAQAKVRVGIETLWKALVKDLRFIIPKLMPNTVEKIELIHGNGGLGSVFLFHLGRGQFFCFLPCCYHYVLAFFIFIGNHLTLP